jgi:hypothetical protein
MGQAGEEQKAEGRPKEPHGIVLLSLPHLPILCGNWRQYKAGVTINTEPGPLFLMLSRAMLRSNFLAVLSMVFVPVLGSWAADTSRARIEGVVVDEAGRPIEGAAVRVLDWGTKVGKATTRSGPDGKFRLVVDDALVNRRPVVASADGGARQALVQTDFMDHRPVVDVRLTLGPSRAVTVRVVDGQKKPVAGASVAALTWVTLPLSGGETDAAGVARLRLPAHAKVDQVVGAKAGVGFDYFENYSTRSTLERAPLPAEVTLILDGARTAHLKAADSAGRPVAGIAMVPWTVKKKGKRGDANLSGCAALPRLSARTDAQGCVVFDWLPRELAGGVNFLAVSDEYHQPENPYLDPAQEDPRLTTRLLHNVPATGKVTLPDGRPAPGILLQAEGRGATNMYFRGYARTGADGSYRFDLYPDQTYIVGVRDDAWAAPSHVGIRAREGGRLEDLPFRLGKGTLLEGRATLGAENKPMAGEIIGLVQRSTMPRAVLMLGAKTDDQGCYRVRIGPGTYELTGPDYEPQELVVRDEPRIVRDFALRRRRMGPLKGLVVTRDGGRPIAGAVVQGESADGGRGGFEATADAQGRFSVERWHARAWAYAKSPDGQLAGFAALAADDAEVKVSLRPAATLVGRLVGKDGRPLPDVRLYVRMEVGPKEARAGSVRLWAQADREGRFVLGGMVPGSRCHLSAYTGNTGLNELKEVVIKGTKALDLGDLVFDLQP